MESFEKLEAWKRSIDLAVEIHRTFSACKGFSFRDEIQRADASISNSIAEGSGRMFPAESKVFHNYAKGSAGEARPQTIPARKRDYINQTTENEWRSELIEISRMLQGRTKSIS